MKSVHSNSELVLYTDERIRSERKERGVLGLDFVFYTNERRRPGDGRKGAHSC